jgi:hypothetical protein
MLHGKLEAVHFAYGELEELWFPIRCSSMYIILASLPPGGRKAICITAVDARGAYISIVFTRVVNKFTPRRRAMHIHLSGRKEKKLVLRTFRSHQIKNGRQQEDCPCTCGQEKIEAININEVRQ